MKLIGHHMEIPSTLCSNVYDFAFCPEPCYDRLVDLADPEDWCVSSRGLEQKEHRKLSSLSIGSAHAF